MTAARSCRAARRCCNRCWNWGCLTGWSATMSCTGFSMARKRLMDIDGARALFWTETNRLCTTPSAPPLVIEEAVWPRVSCLATRLNERLLDLQATGQAEIPRMIGQTLRLLNLPTSDAGDMERNQLPVASPLRGALCAPQPAVPRQPVRGRLDHGHDPPPAGRNQPVQPGADHVAGCGTRPFLSRGAGQAVRAPRVECFC